MLAETIHPLTDVAALVFEGTRNLSHVCKDFDCNIQCSIVGVPVQTSSLIKTAAIGGLPPGLSRSTADLIRIGPLQMCEGCRTHCAALHHSED